MNLLSKFKLRGDKGEEPIVNDGSGVAAGAQSATPEDTGVSDTENTLKKQSLARKIIAMLSLAILILGFLVIFYVQNIEITGNQYCDAMEIADAIQSDSFSVNSVFVMVKYNLGFGKKPPCIDTIRVSLKNPWTISAKVREKDIVGYVCFQEKYGYFDKDGLIVMVSSELIEGMPIIEGIDVESFEKYKVLESKNNKLFGEILTLSLEIRKFELDIDKIILHDDELYMMMGNVLVALGDKVTPEQIAQIQPIFKKLGNQSGILWLNRYNENQKNIIFTKRAKDDINVMLKGDSPLLAGPNSDQKDEEKQDENQDQTAVSQPDTESGWIGETDETDGEITDDTGDQWTEDWTDDSWSYDENIYFENTEDWTQWDAGYQEDWTGETVQW